MAVAQVRGRGGGLGSRGGGGGTATPTSLEYEAAATVLRGRLRRVAIETLVIAGLGLSLLWCWGRRDLFLWLGCEYNWLPVLALLVELVPWAANITGYFSYTWAKALV